MIVHVTKCRSLFMCVVYRNVQNWPRVTNVQFPGSNSNDTGKCRHVLEAVTPVSSDGSTLVLGVDVIQSSHC